MQNIINYNLSKKKKNSNQGKNSKETFINLKYAE